MIINAYFIVGNIGETEEQMLSTASFARSIGVDLIHVSRLRSDPFSDLRGLVEQTPGYHIDAQGFIYSDACSAEQIANLRKQIDRQFYSPLHVAGVVLKLLRLVPWPVRFRGMLTIPVFLVSLIATQADRKLRKWIGTWRTQRPGRSEAAPEHDHAPRILYRIEPLPTTSESQSPF